MPQSIETVNDGEYILIKYLDRIEESASKESIDKVESTLNKNNWNKILIDITMVELVLSVFQIFNFLYRHVFLFSNDIRIALLIDDEEKQNARFAETIAENRGTELKVFFDRKKATEWIKKNKEAL